jgi:hypothetical protein
LVLFRRLVLVALALAIVFVFGRWVLRALASDETHVRWVVEEMIEGFNQAELRPVMAGLAPDYVDTSSGLHRNELREALIYSFFQDVDPRTHDYQFRAEMPPDGLVIEIGEPGHARVVAQIAFYTRVRPTEELFWDARVEGEMEERDEGWQWVRTTSVNHSQRRLPR